MRTVVVGNRKLSKHLLQSLLRQGRNVVGTIIPDGILATKQANYTTIREVVKDANCDVHRTNDINDKETRKWLTDIKPDICLCGGWSQIIEPDILNIPEDGFIGFHSSKLPAGRGGAPVNWSLIRGADEVWISMFYYSSDIDSGDIIAQDFVTTSPRDDIKTIFDALAIKACELVNSVYDDLVKNDVNAKPQKPEKATYRPRRQPQDGLVTWSLSADTLDNWVRALTRPYPGAYTFYNNSRITVWRGKSIGASSANAEPGRVVRVVDGEGIDLQTREGVFRITRVQKEGNPPEWADKFAQRVGVSHRDSFTKDEAPEDWYYTGLRGLLNLKTFDTNLKPGEDGIITPIVLTNAERSIDISVFVDDEEIFTVSKAVEETYSSEVKYSFEESGTYTVSVDFSIDGKHQDTRYLKVFVQD